VVAVVGGGSIRQWRIYRALEVTGEVGEFKDRGELLVADPRSDGDLTGRHSEMAPLELPDYIPGDIRGYFDITRLLWVYGELAYPFFAWADLHARIAVESALRRRLGMDNARTGLGALLRTAIDRGLLTDEGLAGFHETIDVQLEEKQLEGEVREISTFLGVRPEEQGEFTSLVEGMVGPFSGRFSGGGLLNVPRGQTMWGRLDLGVRVSPAPMSSAKRT
jgi:hypothetical protein